MFEELAAAAKRVGPESVIGRRLERRCRLELQQYFRVLSLRVRNLHLEKLADAQLPKDQRGKEQRAHMIQAALHNPLRLLGSHLKMILQRNLQAAISQAAAMNYSEAASPYDILGPSGEVASEYAITHAAELVAGINETTRQLLADAIEQAISQLLGVQGASRLIRNALDDMTKYRADTIARTEISGAMSEAALLKMRDLQIEYKQIILSVDACPICIENHDADPIPVDDAYTSGDLRPPFHPNCRCTVTGSRAPEQP